MSCVLLIYYVLQEVCCVNAAMDTVATAAKGKQRELQKVM